MAIHAFAKASLFLVAGHLIHGTHSRFLCGDLEFGKRMKTAFAVTLIASSFLVGIPLLTAYWVKSSMDVLYEHLWLHHDMLWPIVLLIVISLLYSAVLAKFLSLNFIKGEKPEHEHLEGGGLMKLGYVLMVAMLFVISCGIIIFEEAAHFRHAGGEAMSIGVGLAILVVFIVAVYKPSISALPRFGSFLNDRMYLPYLNDYILPKIGFFISHILDDYVNPAIDGLFNTKVIPGLFGWTSRRVRAIQSGYLSRYINIVLGLVMIILVIVVILVRGVWQ
jgi:NADH-quinone oxidoreductase subunit L